MCCSHVPSLRVARRTHSQRGTSGCLSLLLPQAHRFVADGGKGWFLLNVVSFLRFGPLLWVCSLTMELQVAIKTPCRLHLTSSGPVPVR